MLLQGMDTVMFIVWLIIATIIVFLVMFLAVKVIESDQKAKDKKLMILIVAFISVLVIPIILGFVNTILGFLGNLLAGIRDLIDGGGQNYLTNLTPIIGFLLIFIMVKFFFDITWESSVWVTLLTLFVLYIFYCIAPELYIVISVG